MGLALEAHEVVGMDELDPVAMHRALGFMSLGFTAEQADVLAQLRDERDVFLYHGDVAKRLSGDLNGCPLDIVFDLLT